MAIDCLIGPNAENRRPETAIEGVKRHRRQGALQGRVD